MNLEETIETTAKALEKRIAARLAKNNLVTKTPNRCSYNMSGRTYDEIMEERTIADNIVYASQKCCRSDTEDKVGTIKACGDFEIDYSRKSDDEKWTGLWQLTRQDGELQLPNNGNSDSWTFLMYGTDDLPASMSWIDVQQFCVDECLDKAYALIKQIDDFQSHIVKYWMENNR